MAKAFAVDFTFPAGGWTHSAGDVLSESDLAARGVDARRIEWAERRGFLRQIEAVEDLDPIPGATRATFGAEARARAAEILGG